MKRSALVLLLVLSSGLAVGFAQPAEDGAAPNAAVEVDAVDAAPSAAVAVVSSVVSFAPAAEIINGIDDIKPDGNCTATLKQHCHGVQPGGARLVDCVQAQVEAEETGRARGSTTVSKQCKSELLDFKVLRNTNINRNTNLAKQCKDDAEQLCNITWFFGYKSGQVVACLRDRKAMLHRPCKDEVFKVQLDAAIDYRVDVNLYEACTADAAALCDGVEPGGGRIQACLRDNRLKLRGQCEEELFRQEMENADDIRLSVRLHRTCLPDLSKFCAGVPPDNMKAIDCLDAHRTEEGFTAGCRKEVDAVIERRVRDFRLDPHILTDCEKDIYNQCALWPDADSDSNIISCLQDYENEIQNLECKKRTQYYKRLAAQDIRFNVPLADNCFEDHPKYCAAVPPDMVIRCLESHRGELSPRCRATLLNAQQRFAESIDFQHPMQQACRKETARFCKDMLKGHARIIRCLQDHKDEAMFGAGCRQEVVHYEQLATSDYRLNFRLREACKDDAGSLCKDAKPSDGELCGGKVLRCLVEKKAKLQNKECAAEVIYYQKMVASDWRYDAILAEACHKGVEAYCGGMGPGDVYACLQDNSDLLAAACLKVVRQLEQKQTASIELQGDLYRSCAHERTTYCPDVEDSGGQVFGCLVASLGAAGFGDLCRDELVFVLHRRQSDWRLDPGLREACEGDVAQWCRAEDQSDGADGAVHKCLATRGRAISPGCAHGLARAINTALFVWEPEGTLTAPCDTDAEKFCLKDRLSTAGTPGTVAQCLGTILEDSRRQADSTPNPTSKDTNPDSHYVGRAQLSDQCQQLVQIAGGDWPEGPHNRFGAWLAARLPVNQAQAFQDATGLQLVNVGAYGRAESLTCTGWAFVIGVVAVMLAMVCGALALGYRHYHRCNRNGAGYTLLATEAAPAGTVQEVTPGAGVL